MKNITTSVLGFDPPVSNVPETVPECVTSAGGEENLVAGFVSYRKFHNTNTEARAAIVDALEKVTGIKRETEQVKSPTKADPNRVIDKFAESEQQYADRVRAETKQTTEQLWELIKDEVGVIEFKGQGEARVGGPRVGKMDTTYAQTLIDSGAEVYNKAVGMLQQKNPGLEVELDEAGAPKLESLANAIKVNRARKLAEEKAELGIAA